MTVSCGCPSPAVTIFASHPCELGCDDLGCGTITKVVTEACRLSVLEGGVLTLTFCSCFQVRRETGPGMAASPSQGLAASTPRLRRRGRADPGGRRRRGRAWGRWLPMGEGAWLLFGFGEGGEVWNVFWGSHVLDESNNANDFHVCLMPRKRERRGRTPMAPAWRRVQVTLQRVAHLCALDWLLWPSPPGGMAMVGLTVSQTGNWPRCFWNKECHDEDMGFSIRPSSSCFPSFHFSLT